jgi:hypothetical protein
MAIPNLANVLMNFSDTHACNVNTSSNTKILTVFATHSKTLKLNNLNVTSKSATRAAIVNIRLANSTSSFSLMSNVLMQPNTSVQLINYDSPLYLREGDFLNAWANANGLVDITISYDGYTDLTPNIFCPLGLNTPYGAEVYSVGAGGSGPYGGGGGGSLTMIQVDEFVSSQNYFITVGSGGPAGGTTRGANSTFEMPTSPTSRITLISGWGGGGGGGGSQPGAPGSSGGGGGANAPGGSGIAGFGQPGGPGGGYINGSGGGGGIQGGGGGAWAYFHGGGGGGLTSTIANTAVTYGQGGAGAGGGPGGPPGTGGGGSGGTPGASGAIIIKYLGTQRGIGGSNIDFTGTHTVHTFLNSGLYRA